MQKHMVRTGAPDTKAPSAARAHSTQHYGSNLIQVEVIVKSASPGAAAPAASDGVVDIDPDVVDIKTYVPCLIACVCDVLPHLFNITTA